MEGAPGAERVRARIMRRTVIRYLLLAYILCIRRNSSRLTKRFPNMIELIKTGIVRADEARRIGKEESAEMYGSRWWIPIKWAVEVLNTAKREGFITNQPGYSHIMGRLSDFRRGLTDVASYGYLPVPLVYTQVVHLAVYVFFAVSLVGEQWIIWKKEGDEEVDLYYPVFMTVRLVQFVSI